MTIVKNDKIKTKIKNGFFYLIFPEYEIKHYNYLNLISETYKFHLFKFHSKFSKSYEFYFSEINYLSDDGFLFSNIKEEKLFSFDSIFLDISDSTINESMIGSIEFISNRKVQKYQRIYLKIQYILADIATLIGFINIIMKFITRFFTKKIYSQGLENYYIIVIKNQIKKS